MIVWICIILCNETTKKNKGQSFGERSEKQFSQKRGLMMPDFMPNPLSVVIVSKWEGLFWDS